MQRRRCPNCQAFLPIGSGVCFDDQNNVLCGKCGKPIIATTAAAEREMVGKAIAVSAAVGWPQGGYNYGSRPLGLAHQSPPWQEPTGHYPDACM